MMQNKHASVVSVKGFIYGSYGFFFTLINLLKRHVSILIGYTKNNQLGVILQFLGEAFGKQDNQLEKGPFGAGEMENGITYK